MLSDVSLGHRLGALTFEDIFEQGGDLTGRIYAEVLEAFSRCLPDIGKAPIRFELA